MIQAVNQADMSLTFLHTADWQLGKPFASVSNEAKRFRLQDQRVQTIRSLAQAIKDSGAAFVVVAGDLFDSPHVTKSTVSAACAAIGSLQVPVIAIPGNHDHGGPGSIWQQTFFEREQQQLAPNLRVLLTPEPLVLDSAVLFPAPLLRRHEPGDPTAWIRQAALDPTLPPDLPRIVLAHGTIQGFGSQPHDDDDDATPANWIDITQLTPETVDYIALGDWHGTKQVGPNAWYSGTPEIDRFPKGEGNDPGNILTVTVSRGQPPVVTKTSTSQFAWKEMAFRFSDDASLELFSQQLDARIGPRGGQHLLLLTLEGALGMEATRQLEHVIESLEARLVRLKLESRVTTAPTEEEIAALTQSAEDPLIASVATQLLARSRSNDETAAIAQIALRELYSALA